MLIYLSLFHISRAKFISYDFWLRRPAERLYLKSQQSQRNQNSPYGRRTGRTIDARNFKQHSRKSAVRRPHGNRTAAARNASLTCGFATSLASFVRVARRPYDDRAADDSISLFFVEKLKSLQFSPSTFSRITYFGLSRFY